MGREINRPLPVLPVVACPDEQVILDLALGALAPVARQETWAHMQRCQPCAELIGAALPFLGPDPPPAADHQAQPETPGTQGRDSDPGIARASAGAAAGADTTPGAQVNERAARSLQPGQDLRQRYRVVRYLGHGGMGEVYEARHARLVGRYALKILNVDLTHNPMARQRFRREAGIASELRHPNIVQVIDFDETENGRPYLVMEMLEGSDLGAIIAAGRLPVARTLALAGQIAAGLAAMHAQGIVHRDLKPANVFVLPEGTGQPERVKLVDFGLSKRLAPSLAVTHDRMLLGTPQYMAPEQARGNSIDLGPAADQFAMAAIVYEMLAGRPAFDGELLSVVLYRIVYESPPPLASLVPDLPPEIEAAITRALSKNPDDRFPSVGEFWEALAAGARDGASQPVANHTERPGAVRLGPRGRMRRLAISAGIVGVGLAVRWILLHPARPIDRRQFGTAPTTSAAPPLGEPGPERKVPQPDSGEATNNGATEPVGDPAHRIAKRAFRSRGLRVARSGQPPLPFATSELAAAPTVAPATPDAGAAAAAPIAPDSQNLEVEPAEPRPSPHRTLLVPHL